MNVEPLFEQTLDRLMDTFRQRPVLPSFRGQCVEQSGTRLARDHTWSRCLGHRVTIQQTVFRDPCRRADTQSPAHFECSKTRAPAFPLTHRATFLDVSMQPPLTSTRLGHTEPRRERPRGRARDAFARRGRGRSRLGSVPALTEPLTGAAQNAAPCVARRTRASRCSDCASVQWSRRRPHIAGERSCVEPRVEGGG